MKKFFGCLGIIVLGVIVLIGVLALSAVGTYNSIVSNNIAVDSKWSQVQNVYQRRADLVPNLVATVLGAAQFEKSTLTEVTNARASVGRVTLDPAHAPADAEKLKEFQAAQGQLSNALSRLMVVSERYPELKANGNFQTLQSQLEGTENRIAVERRNFNLAVESYNNSVSRFPGMFVAQYGGFKPRPWFEAEQGAQKAPAVNFNSTPAPASTP